MVGALGYQQLQQTRPTQTQSRPERRWVVEALTLQRADHQPTLTAYGRVTAGRVAELRSPVTGEVTRSELADGRFVTANTLLLAIDDLPYRSAVADRRTELAQLDRQLAQFARELPLLADRRAQAEADVVLVTAQWQRLESLRSRQAIDLNAVDEAKRALLTAQRTVLELQQAILQRETAQQDAISDRERAQRALALAERDLQHTQLTAPFDGWLQTPPIALGQRITPTDVVARLIDPSRLEVRLALPDGAFARIQQDLVHRPAQVFWRLGDTETAFTGQVVRLGADLADQKGGIPLWIALDPVAASAALRPGALVRVELADQWFRDVFAVPPAALNDNYELFAIVEGRLVRHFATVHHRQADRWLIRTDLPDGAAIVARQFRGIGPGLAIRLAADKS